MGMHLPRKLMYLQKAFFILPKGKYHLLDQSLKEHRPIKVSHKKVGSTLSRTLLLLAVKGRAVAFEEGSERRYNSRKKHFMSGGSESDR